jgi:phosphate:Na+ symporter
MHRELLESLRLALAVFLQAEPRDAKRLAARKTQFREFEAAATALSLRLLRSAAAASRLAEADGAERVAEESDLFLRTVRDLRRVHSHLASFAYPVIHRVRGRGHRGTAGGTAEAAGVTASAATPAVSPANSSGGEDEDLG